MRIIIVRLYMVKWDKKQFEFVSLLDLCVILCCFARKGTFNHANCSYAVYEQDIVQLGVSLSASEKWTSFMLDFHSAFLKYYAGIF